MFTIVRKFRLTDPAQTHRLHQLVDASRRNTPDPRLLDHRDQRLLRDLPCLQERREVAPLTQLRNAQLQFMTRVLPFGNSHNNLVGHTGWDNPVAIHSALDDEAARPIGATLVTIC